ncbi:MAG: protein-L-isoaspartate(D-aspartate) O-methyltransferase [Bacteroidetes bacterium]|nr:protein-L-isoaspartate(D-aspartate) O-methyltransferase [Bacteroidota bacterium]
MPDTYLHKGMRKKLVDDIAAKGIRDAAVLKALNAVPRHIFMESGFIKFAYKDNAFPIGAGQTISQPYTVAFQTELLNVQKGHKVLEIGTGSGYQTAILLEMGAKVYTVERIRELFVKASGMLPKMGYNPHFFYGDGYKGKKAYSPFDRILVTAGASEVPEELKNQLALGGIMVIPVGGSGVQKMIRVEKKEDNEFEITEHGSFVFVPLLKGKT